MKGENKHVKTNRRPKSEKQNEKKNNTHRNTEKTTWSLFCVGQPFLGTPILQCVISSLTQNWRKMIFPFSLISTAESFSVKSGLLITVYESLLTGMCLYHVHVCACSGQNSIRTAPGAGAPECHEMWCGCSDQAWVLCESPKCSLLHTHVSSSLLYILATTSIFTLAGYIKTCTTVY